MANLTEARFAAKSVEYETPQGLFDQIHAEFGFTLDVAATQDNAKCPRYFTRAGNGLAQPWEGTCWCNPPYGRKMPLWIRKARTEAELGKATTVLLIPARTNTGWWHDECLKGEVRFLRGRPRFNNGKHGLPFPLALVIFRRTPTMTEKNDNRQLTVAELIAELEKYPRSALVWHEECDCMEAAQEVYYRPDDMIVVISGSH